MFANSLPLAARRLGLGVCAVFCLQAVPGETNPLGARQPPPCAGVEQQRVLTTIDRFFAALAALDQAAAAELLLPTGSLFFERRQPDGSYALRSKANAAWLAELPRWKQRPSERTFDSRVELRGPIAAVSQRYIFKRDGRISHCGHNLIQLAKDGGEWRIANMIWTEERSGCGDAR